MTNEIDKSIDPAAANPGGPVAAFFTGALEADALSLEAQVEAAATGVVLLDRTHLTRVAAHGADRVGFLHNMLSADIKNLGASRGTEATFLTNKGKLIAHLTVFDDGEQTLLETESNCVDALLGGLSRYIISEDVTLEHLREEASFSVEGLGASKLLALVSGASFEELDALPHLGIIRTGRSRTGPTEDVRITARRFDPSPRFDIAASEAIAIDLLTTLRDNGATAASAELARTRRIESGRPEFGVDMDDSHLPLEASLNEAVNFEKGCYIGQEYVVRLAHRGHLNRKLVGLRIDSETPLPSGLKLTSGDSEAGELTSSAYSPTLGATVALGYVKRDFFEPGTVLQVQGDIDATVTELPLLKQDSAQTD